MQSLFIYNARLWSSHDRFEKGEDSIVLENGRIKAIGRYSDLQSFRYSGIQVLDAEGKTVMPGFNDSHIHIWKVGNLKTFMLDLRQAVSLDHMLSMLSDYHQRFPEAQWILARGFNESGWNDRRFPNRHDLDRVTTEKPIWVIHTSAHSAVANSKAIALASVHSGSVIPAGGEMQVGADGQPNGVFAETALGLIANHIPSYSKSELKTMILAAREEMYQYGITAATDPAVDPLLLEVYRELNNDMNLGLRLNIIPILLPDGSDKPFPIPEAVDSAFLRINAVKFFSDGGLSNKTAAIKRTYLNAADHGILRLNHEQYLKLSMAAMENGLGIATHAIGDLAIDFVIETYKRLHRAFPLLLNRIEHLGLPSKKNLEDMAKFGIATSMQTIFIRELGRNFIRYLDNEYLDQCYPVRSVINQGILAALSSDAPVVRDFNPIMGIQSAVTRKTDDGNLIAPHESITMQEALGAYTSNAARIGSVTDTGLLAEGKLADLIVLHQNPIEVGPENLSKVKVAKTFIAGEMVWSDK